MLRNDFNQSLSSYLHGIVVFFEGDLGQIASELDSFQLQLTRPRSPVLLYVNRSCSFRGEAARVGLGPGSCLNSKCSWDMSRERIPP